MNAEPKNYVVIYSGWSTRPPHGDAVINKAELEYKNYSKYEYLPWVVQSPETRAEYDAWWKWFRENEYKEP